VLKLVIGTDISVSTKRALSPALSLFIGPHVLEHPPWVCARHSDVSLPWWSRGWALAVRRGLEEEEEDLHPLHNA